MHCQTTICLEFHSCVCVCARLNRINFRSITTAMLSATLKYNEQMFRFSITIFQDFIAKSFVFGILCAYCASKAIIYSAIFFGINFSSFFPRLMAAFCAAIAAAAHTTYQWIENYRHRGYKTQWEGSLFVFITNAQMMRISKPIVHLHWNSFTWNQFKCSIIFFD